MSSEEVKQKIIITAIECIEQEGFQNVTIRKIAEAAGVNVAAINYHFGSKEQLLEIAMNATLNESYVNNINDYAEMWQSDTRNALKSFLEDTLAGASNYPNLTKAHLSDAFNKNDLNSNSVRRTNDFLSEFHGLISNILRSENELENKMEVVQLFSVFLMTSILPGLFDQFLGVELKTPENQKRFIEVLLKNYLKNYS
ncbi:MAG: helix-turn-helix domain-containing protein [Candidatus Cloacimonadales bacterium]|nr:helix-turn-helix domain-containing protein [Candidatus Cloacimonadales bacterium]